jgi:hypothetical protein
MVFFPARRWRTNAVPRELPPATPPYGHFYELELNGPGNGYTYVSRDVLANVSSRLSYGIRGTGPTDLVAGIGTLSWSMDNSQANSAATLGYYTINHASCRPGFRRGIGVRYRYRVPNTYRVYTKFVGRLLNADPEAGEWSDRRVTCEAGDWMLEAAGAPISLPTQLNKRADELLALVAAAVPRQPTYTQFDIGLSTFPYSFDNSRSESDSALTMIQKIAQSEPARCYMRGGLGLNGTILRGENRSSRLTPVPVAAFYGTQQGFRPQTKPRNRAKVVIHPRDVGPNNTTVLCSKADTSNPQINPGETIEITLRYTDLALRASRIGGTDYQNPITATTDYLFNALANGSGADLTANLSVVTTFDANQAKFRCTNTGGVLGFLTKLQGRGRTLKDYDPQTAEDSDAASIALEGESLISFDMPLQSDFLVAQAVAQFFVDTWAAPGAIEVDVRFIPKDDAEMELAMSLEPGHPISLQENVTAVNGVYHIQSVDIEIDGDKTVFEWGCQRALVQSYWSLGTVGFSELGISTVLAPL